MSLRTRFNALSAFITLLIMLGFSSCRTPKDVVYFQDLGNQTVTPIAKKQLVIKPLDELNIIVNTRDPQVTDMFNMPYVSRQLGLSSRNSGYGQSQGVVPYNVDAEGNIMFPIVGTVHVAGLTRTQVAEKIRDLLISQDLAKNPIVTVTILNAHVNVLGEVNSPGAYAISNDDMTLLDALGLAGDLTIQGQRESVKVIRKNGDQTETYVVNLLSGKELAESPAYYVQQDDVIYVEPNNTRIRQSELNANTVLTPSFWVSIASVCITVIALIVR